MKKKIIFVAVCVVLLLIFVSTGYGGGGGYGKYILLERPHQEELSPPRGDQFDDVVLVALPTLNNLCLVVYVGKDFYGGKPASQNILKREGRSGANIAKKGGKLK
jgi:hypothetical protein